MIFFGHLGLTTGAVKTCEVLINKNRLPNDKISIDYRLVLIGSILPDVIDKPIGAFLFRSTFHNSRIFAHTLLFSAVLLLLGLYRLYKHRKNNVLVLGASTSIHLLLDSMWLFPGIIYWPYFGLRFPARPEGHWLESDIIKLLTDPNYYLPELIGFAILAYFFIRVIKNKELMAFITKGKL